MILHRICNSNFKDDISGSGARLFGSRWNSKGIPMLYTTEHISLAALEMLVHINYTEVPVSFHVLSVFIPDNTTIAALQFNKLKLTWRNDTGYSTFIGDEFIKSKEKYENEIIGYNMRMDECQAAFLSIKLRYLSKWTIERQQIATWYDHGLSDLEEITLPYTLPDSTHVYHLYVIRSQHRNELQRHLNDLGIGTLIHYPIPPYLQKAYYHLGIVRGQYPIAEEIADTCLSLPLYPGLSRQEVNEIVTAIKSFYS